MAGDPAAALSLLSHCSSGGCGVKIGPAELAAILAAVPGSASPPELLVGFDGSDDALVYRISEDRALVSTVDFFPPMVEDPHLFGQIAAANALSDVYAMGGRPLFALNLVCFPEKLDRGILAQILAGGAAKAREADTVIAGGHSIYDHEPKYGLAVTGEVHPAKILRNTGALPGDALILTKALGVGLVMAAHRAGLAEESVLRAVTDSMTRLNRAAAEAISRCRSAAPPVHACTDVTGFGLGIHAAEMAGRDRTFTILGDSLPILPGALEFAQAFLVTAAGQRNRNAAAGRADVTALPQAMGEIAFDPQTSGGLLIAVAPECAEDLRRDIERTDPAVRIIGVVSARETSEAPAVIFV